MSRPSIQDLQVCREISMAQVRAGAHVTSDPASLTSAAAGVNVTYTTDDPGITGNGALTVADGDAVTAAENLQHFEELNQWFVLLRADVSALRDAIIALNDGGVADPNAALPLSPTTGTFNSGVVVTYTTDDPSITPNNAITIADGDAVTAAEIHETFVELGAELLLQQADYSELANRVNAIIVGDAKALVTLGAVPALTSAANPLAFTYTTDDPSITANGAVTVADGDTPTAAELHELGFELEDQADKLQADLVALRAVVVTLVKKSGVHGT